MPGSLLLGFLSPLLSEHPARAEPTQTKGWWLSERPSHSCTLLQSFTANTLPVSYACLPKYCFIVSSSWAWLRNQSGNSPSASLERAFLAWVRGKTFQMCNTNLQIFPYLNSLIPPFFCHQKGRRWALQAQGIPGRGGGRNMKSWMVGGVLYNAVFWASHRCYNPGPTAAVGYLLTACTRQGPSTFMKLHCALGS